MLSVSSIYLKHWGSTYPKWPPSIWKHVFLSSILPVRTHTHSHKHTKKTSKQNQQTKKQPAWASCKPGPCLTVIKQTKIITLNHSNSMYIVPKPLLLKAVSVTCPKLLAVQGTWTSQMAHGLQDLGAMDLPQNLKTWGLQNVYSLTYYNITIYRTC